MSTRRAAHSQALAIREEANRLDDGKIHTCCCPTLIWRRSIPRSCTGISFPRHIRLVDSRLGFSRPWVTPQSVWQELEADLRIQHLTQDAQPGESLPEGQVFRIRAILKGPNGQSAVVLSVWFVAAVGGAPRFVTAYPGGAK